MFEAELNVFIDKGVGHVKVFVPAVAESYDTEGRINWADPDPARIAGIYNALVAALSEGHELGKEPPRFLRGGNGAKPEDAPPDDLKNHIPVHCEEKMVYRKAYKSQAGKDVGAKFQCRKGEQCERAETFNGKKYGYSIWEDRVRKEIEAELA